MRRSALMLILTPALTAIMLGTVGLVQQAGMSRASGQGIEDPLTGAKHAGVKNWRPTPLRNGDVYMQRNTLLPPAQIACGFASGMFNAQSASDACAGFANGQKLAEVVAADGRKGEVCASVGPTRTGYAMNFKASFAQEGAPSTIVTCAALADGMQFNAFNAAQHEKEVRTFLAGLTIPETAQNMQAEANSATTKRTSTNITPQPRVTNTPCMEVHELDERAERSLRPVQPGRVTGSNLTATSGSATCTGDLTVNGRKTGSVTCQVRGPALFKWDAGQDVMVFEIPQGRSATVVELGRERRDIQNGVISCFENAPG
jgi:hypothetical protein